MSISEVIRSGRAGAARIDHKMVLAFAAIYFLWGATFLAIRVAVQEIPPFFSSGARFLIAGGALYLFMRARGESAPTAVQWRALAVTALCMFVATYGALFWAEQFVPSGVTSVIEAALPIITIVLEVFVFRQQPFEWRMGVAVVLGFVGIAWLVLPGGQAFSWFPCLVILGGATVWSLGAVLTRSMPRPRSLPLTAGAQMLLGGAVLLALSQLTGELQTLPHISVRAALALLYLIVGGSLLGFTAYVWLLARMPATRVASHAYVNPLVALALGYFAAGETLTLRMVLASGVVVASVFLLLARPRRRAPTSPAPADSAPAPSRHRAARSRPGTVGSVRAT